MPTGPVELRVRDHQWRSLLAPGAVVEVWRGAQLVGELPGALVALLLDHHLSAARLLGAVAGALEDTMRHRTSSVVIPTAVQAARRARRHARRVVIVLALLLAGCASLGGRPVTPAPPSVSTAPPATVHRPGPGERFLSALLDFAATLTEVARAAR